MNDPDVIIIGAPRSGTNMLRDVLTALDGFHTWNCDEINLTWRHHNRSVPHDELTPDHATPRVRDYMARQFRRLQRAAPGAAVVEKTCANSLRVDFVHRIRPDARFVFIYRDGLDAAASAMRRWHAPFDLRYTTAKVRHAPPLDVTAYGADAVGRQVRRFLPGRASDTTGGWWGPKPRDWQDLAATRPLDEQALLQWQRCVEQADEMLAGIPEHQVTRMRYEAFVADPAAGLQALLSFLGKEQQFRADAVASVRSSSVGEGRASFAPADRDRLVTLVTPTLRRFGHVA